MENPTAEDCHIIKSRHVRLEDVHSDNKTMQKVCSFLEIDHFESLSKFNPYGVHLAQ